MSNNTFNIEEFKEVITNAVATTFNRTADLEIITTLIETLSYPRISFLLPNKKLNPLLDIKEADEVYYLHIVSMLLDIRAALYEYDEDLIIEAYRNAVINTFLEIPTESEVTDNYEISVTDIIIYELSGIAREVYRAMIEDADDDLEESYKVNTIN